MPPKQAVEARPATPPRISLLTSAVIVAERERWEAGFSYEPETCGGGEAFDPCDDAITKDETLGAGSVDVEPFWVVAPDACSSFGFAARNAKQRAARRLAACESAVIETELWRGDVARASGWSNKFLTSLDSDVVTSVPADPVDALACLEQGLAECNCGTRGMIHAMPQVVTYWAQQHLVRREADLILTTMDTIVVPGSGYDGSGPAAGATPAPAASGSIWAYATGMVHIRLSPVTVVPDNNDEALDRSTNTLVYRAERIAAATWDCCLVAAEIDLPLCGIGGAGS